MAVVRDVVAADELVLVIDVDTLERSALARIDRVMLLALDSLGHAGVDVVLLSRDESGRADLLRQGITSAASVTGGATAIASVREARPRARLVILTDDPMVLLKLADRDRGIALGRPELVNARIATIGDASVRATLWWMLDERLKTIGELGALTSAISTRS